MYTNLKIMISHHMNLAPISEFIVYIYIQNQKYIVQSVHPIKKRILIKPLLLLIFFWVFFCKKICVRQKTSFKELEEARIHTHKEIQQIEKKKKNTNTFALYFFLKKKKRDLNEQA